MAWNKQQADNIAWLYSQSLTPVREDPYVHLDPCAVCGDPKGGPRIIVTGTLAGDTEPRDLPACHACAMYIANGDTPDTD